MKKGFTLVELLAVIIIIAVTSMIVFPAIGDVIADAKKDLYNSQVLDIQAASEKWATDNINLLDKYHLNDTYIYLADIRSSGYLEKDEIINPLTKETMNGCIQIKYNFDNKKYNYVYNDLSCDEIDFNTLGSIGYIIYTYDSKTKSFIQSENSKILNPAGLSIYNYYVANNLIKADGEVMSEGGALYDLENEYVFRGPNPNNYVEFDSDGNGSNETWRILSINKKDYSLKLIESTTSLGAKEWASNDGLDVANSTLVQSLTETVTEKTSNKIVNSDFNTSKIDANSYSIRTLASTMTNTTSLKIGTISVLDYVNASATLECPSDYLSSRCSENNYLRTIFGNLNSVWTVNTNGVLAWYIDTDGMLKLENAGYAKNVYKVIKLNTNVYLDDENAVGSDSYKYIIK